MGEWLRGSPKGVLARDGESLSALIEKRITHGFFFSPPFLHSSLLFILPLATIAQRSHNQMGWNEMGGGKPLSKLH